ncbi:MAG: AtpZ/AtpI family protein [Candidatus Dadabacteria bacterium]
MSTQKPNRNNDILKYAGMGTQIFASLGIAVFVGRYIDSRWIRTTIPILTLLLPVMVLFVLIYSLIRQTSKKNNDEDKK